MNVRAVRVDVLIIIFFGLKYKKIKHHTLIKKVS